MIKKNSTGQQKSTHTHTQKKHLNRKKSIKNKNQWILQSDAFKEIIQQ